MIGILETFLWYVTYVNTNSIYLKFSTVQCQQCVLATGLELRIDDDALSDLCDEFCDYDLIMLSEMRDRASKRLL